MNFNSILEELDKLYEEKVTESSELKPGDRISTWNDDEGTVLNVEGDRCEVEWDDGSVSWINKKDALAPVKEGCAKKALKEAAADDEEVEIVDEESVEEPAEEEIPGEDAETVEDFLKSVGEYDSELKLEFKPIVIDGKEYTISNILWDDTLEEGKLVAEVIFDMPEEEPVDEEIPEEEVVEENFEKDGELEEILDIKPSINLSLDGGQGNDVDVL